MRVRFRRPSPALLISCLALVMAMGGTTYAVTALPANSVGSAQLRAAAVTNAKLGSRAVSNSKIRDRSVTSTRIARGAISSYHVKDGSITGFDVKNNTLGGNQIAESKLGTVPSATQATTTTGLTVLATKRLAESPDEAGAPPTTLGTRGPFTIYAKCFAVAGGTRAALYVSVPAGTQAVFGTDGADTSGDTSYLTSATPEADREIQVVTAGPDTVASNAKAGLFRASDRVTTVSGPVGGAFAKNGTVPGGDGPFQGGNACIVGGGGLIG